MSEEGALEQKPEAQPVEQAPVLKTKKSKLGIVTAILAVLLVGAVGYIVYGLVTAPKTDKQEKKEADCPVATYDREQMSQNEERLPNEEKKESEEGSGGSGVVYPDKDFTKYLGGGSVDTGGDATLKKVDEVFHPNYNEGYVTLSTSGHGSMFVTNDGDVYYDPLFFSYDKYSIDKIENYSKVADYGHFTIPEDKLSYVDFNSTPGTNFYGYKLKFKNIVHANAMYFGNGDNTVYIALIDKDGNFNMVALRYKSEANVDGVRVVTRTAYIYKNVAEYQGAVAIQGATDGSGRDNIVYFRDGRYKYINSALFYPN